MVSSPGAQTTEGPATRRVGFSCAYAPLPLFDAAGFAPCRILPLGDAPDEAGRLLHDNLCPHVKRIVDRALAGDLPALAGVVFVASCDAMRRTADAWRRARPADPAALLDLPAAADDLSVDWFAGELRALAGTLARWGGRTAGDEDLARSLERHDEAARRMAAVRARAGRGTLAGGAARLQALTNDVATAALDRAGELLAAALAEPEAPPAAGVPVFLFGNVLPDPGALALFESCGLRLAGDDLCTGSRLLQPIGGAAGGDPFVALARGLLERPPCARTIDPARPGRLAGLAVAAARSCGARGVVCHTAKFCDPYLARLPAVRAALREAGFPVLTLEGDCTLRSLGQQRTRIEAFVEMLGR